MANQFSFNNAVYFTFNGTSSKLYGYRMQTVGDNNEPILLGLKRETKREETSHDVDNFKGVKNQYNDIKITITKADSNHNLIPFTTEDIFELNRWLFKNEPLPFFTDKSSLQYYVVFKSSEGSFNFANQGYIDLTMECLPTAYSPIAHNNIHVIGTEQVEIINKTDVDHKIIPDIIVKMKTGSSFKITNLTNKSTFSINTLQSGEFFHVLGDRRFICSQIDSKRNLYKISSQTFMFMEFGRNQLKIETDGECDVEIIHQMKMGWGR